MGAGYYPHSILVNVFQIMLCIIPIFFIPIRLRFPSHYAIWILYFTAYIPNILLPILSTRVIDVGMLLYALCVFVGMSFLALIPKRMDFRLWQLGAVEFRWILIFTSAAILAINIATFGFPTEFLSLSDVYLKRGEFTEELRAAGLGLAYLNPILTNVLLPSIVYIGIIRKEITIILIYIVMYALLFNITTSKGVLFTPLFIIGLYFITVIKADYKPIFMTLVLSLTILVLLVADVVFFEAPILSGLITLRLLIIQGVLSGMVQDYFHTHQFYYYSYGFLNHLVDAGHIRSLPEAIGINYLWRSWTSHANVNFWANAYANLGYFGILFMSAVFAGILWLYDSIWYSKSRNLGSILLGLLIISVANTGLQTVFLSNGLWFAFILGFIVPFSAQIRAGRMFPSIYRAHARAPAPGTH